jgi:ammonia channel protein AmtB
VNLKVDDVVDASPVHMFCGIWGAIATGLFCDQATFRDSYNASTNVHNGYGLFVDVSYIFTVLLYCYIFTVIYLQFYWMFQRY